MTQTPPPTEPLAAVVARAIDAAGLGANAPALLLELQADLGTLAAHVGAATERGRRPFRPPAGWGEQLAAIGLGLYNLADQTGVDLDLAVRTRAVGVIAAAQHAAAQPDAGWPFA